MGLRAWKPFCILALAFLFFHCDEARAQAPVIANLSADSGSAGTLVDITGSGFGTAQGSSTVALNGTSAQVANWTDTAIVVLVPSGATSGPFSVTVSGQTAYSESFTITALPSGWPDGDVGSVGVAGSASYAGGTFTVKGSGTYISYVADGMHFAYQPLSGNGTIIARVLTASGADVQAGVMIRETLNANSTNAYTFFGGEYSYMEFSERPSTGSNTSVEGDLSGATLSYWVEMVRNGSSFSAYASRDGVNWAQLGSTQTITMAQNAYIGLAVSSDNNSALSTATFDNVSVNSTAGPSPVITSLSATTGSVGSQVVITGSGFGASQGGIVLLNGSLVTINSWSATSITIVIPSGATSGFLVVSVAPSMNDSNAVMFTVTSNPLPAAWLDQDIGSMGVAGTATYSGGTFTLQSSGAGIGGTADGMHFAYQPLSGDGTIVARVVTVAGTSSAEAGIMIRATLSPGAEMGSTTYIRTYGDWFFRYRTTTGQSDNHADAGTTLPLWVMLVRSGNTFSAYTSPDGENWTQGGSSQTITMAQNVYVGLALSSGTTSTVATATFDNVSISPAANPAPVITTISATTGSIGSVIAIGGSGFGATQGSSLVTLNAVPVNISSWTSSAINITIPSGATSGLLVVSVGPSMNDSNPVYFTVTSQPLPAAWLDQDIGSMGTAGSATYVSGTFTLKSSGAGIGGTADGMHFAYQPLSGDGSIVARVVTVTGSGTAEAGVMIRETLSPGAKMGSTTYGSAYGYWFFRYRTTTGGSDTHADGTTSLPVWVKLVRSGSTFTAYTSSNGSSWTQAGSNQTISMAQNVYIGLALSSGYTSSVATATFDNVSVTTGLMPLVTSLSPNAGPVGTTVTISGTSFGSSQGSSTVAFNGTLASSVTSWSNSQIVATVPTTVSTGPVVVTVSSNASNSDVIFTAYNPVINSLLPPAAPTGGQVTLSGYGFGPTQGSSQVQFNGVTVSVVTWSDPSVTVYIPTTVTSGPVTLTMNGVTSNSVQFTVIEPLSVTAITPSVGPIGTSVTVTGAGFGANQSDSGISFNGITAVVTSWSDTAIAAMVPSGAVTGPVIVEVAGTTVLGPVFTVNTSIQLTDSLGNQSTYVAAMAGGKWYVSSAQGSGCSSCTLRGTIQYQYDGKGNLTSITDELGRVTAYSHDTNNDTTSIVAPAVGGTNPTTSYTYNSFGEVLTMTDPLGHVTTNTYDSHGNLLSVATPAPNSNTAAGVTQFSYNSLGELTQITDPLGRTTAITYATAGLIASITDPQQNVTSYQYDSRGNRTLVIDALGNHTTFAYDSGSRLLTITYPDSTTTTFAYDYRGRRISVTDQNGKTTNYAYDDADRLTSVTDPAGNVTQYGYDTESNLLSITDANGHATAFSYDAFGRVTQTSFPSNYYETYGYDGVGNLTSKTDRKGQTITYVYDALNRLTQKTYPDTTSVEYVYDLVGKVLQVNDPSGTYGFAYDNMGRLIGTSAQYSFLSSTTFSNSYSYDAASNRTGFTAPDGSTNSYSYDTLNRLSTLANSWAGSFGFSYDALSRRTQLSRPNYVTTNYSYDSRSRLLSAQHQLSGGTIDGAAYSLDAVGNRTAKLDELANVTSNYGYDSLYELTGVTQGTNTTESYTYDPVGNRLSSLGVSSYTYNSSNELTSTSSTSYTYDYNGNLTTDTNSSGTTSYAWDFENRLTSVTLPNSGGTVIFKYDPFGRRIYKQSPNTTSIFVYDGENLVQTVNSTGGVVARYTQTTNIDEPLAESRSGTTSYYEADGLGSITSLTASNGSIGQSYTYDSFGNQTNSSGSLRNYFRYTAREFDTESNLYFYRARYYDPSAGRFISEDPIGFGGGRDFYVYVRNSPTYLIDPLGLDALGGDIQHLQNIFPGSDWQPANNALVIHLPCSQVRQTLSAQGYQSANSWGYNGPGSAFWNPLDHSGGTEYRTFGPGFHFRMQYDQPDPFAKCPNQNCTLDQFHIDSHNPIEPGQTWQHLKCDFLHWCGS